MRHQGGTGLSFPESDSQCLQFPCFDTVKERLTQLEIAQRLSDFEVFASTDSGCQLPPYDLTNCIINHFFFDFNQYIPLFDKEKLVSGYKNWYDDPNSHQDTATWAVINIVLALGLQTIGSNAFLKAQSQANICAKNAQMALRNSAARINDLSGVQVFLALAVFFQRSLDHRQAHIFVSSAIKLAYRHKIHSRKSQSVIGIKEALEQQRAFWIAYVLDRDLALRMQDPFLIRDEDFDVELPEPEDLLNISSEDDTSEPRESWNFFRWRIQLACIQGETCSSLCSVRAERLSPSEKTEKREAIWSSLRELQRAMPPALQFKLLSKIDTNAPTALVSLQFTQLRIMCTVEDIAAQNSQWLKKLIDHATLASEIVDKFSETTPKILPSHWSQFVIAARHCMVSFRSLTKFVNGTLGNCDCTYFSAILILIVTKLTVWENGLLEDFEIDEKLIVEGMFYIKQKCDVVRKAQLDTMTSVFEQLNVMGTTIISNFMMCEVLLQSGVTGGLDPFPPSEIGTNAVGENHTLLPEKGMRQNSFTEEIFSAGNLRAPAQMSDTNLSSLDVQSLWMDW